MRWDELFADIEGQLEQELDASRLDLVAEEERLRLGRLGLRDRLVAMSRGGDGVRVTLDGGEQLELRIDSAGRDWVAGEFRSGELRRAVVVPLAAIVAVLPVGDQLERGLRAPAAEPASDLAGRLGLAFVLRDLCRRRAPVELTSTDGSHHGTIDRVGRDHLDLAEHEAGDPRRERLVRRIRIVPLTAIRSVRI
ncbi:hypothetical protein [Protaetiibacter intestinalis]|uniref:Uncharacterized protein n=1 Tax=Protaetiibacter intestinalis TaxID=2419774 RepID=A0A387B7I7_9MICO|nr:hypothetical protein [Protaetiibacter intestinalis]AYF97155.1 hypothetical protein D7I47_02110 [Protaetiibacter intestinalis]